MFPLPIVWNEDVGGCLVFAILYGKGFHNLVALGGENLAKDHEVGADSSLAANKLAASKHPRYDGDARNQDGERACDGISCFCSHATYYIRFLAPRVGIT